MTFRQARALVMSIGTGTALGWYAWCGVAPIAFPQPQESETPPPPSTIERLVPESRSAVVPDFETRPEGSLEDRPTVAFRILAEPIRDGGTRESKSRPRSAESAERLTEDVALVSAPINDTPTTTPPLRNRSDSLSETRRVLSTEEVVAKTEGSVALVRGEKAFGTGFLIRSGILVTNAHVISQDTVKKLRVTFTSAPAGEREAAVKGLLWEDVRRDLAFLAVDTKLAPLDIESGYKFRRGQEVTVIGNPGTGAGEILENAVSRGVMSTLMTHKNQSFFQMSVSINPGNSGGPVIGSEGRVVGVATLKSILREGIAGCIPVADLAAALKRVESLPRSAVVSAGAIHDIRTAINPIDEMGNEYAKTLEAFARLMDEGGMRGLDPAQIRRTALRGFRRESGDRLHQKTITSLYPDLLKADADPHLPADARTPLHQLWRNLLELQKNAEFPRGSSNEIRDIMRTLKARQSQFVEQLNDAFEAAVVAPN